MQKDEKGYDVSTIVLDKTEKLKKLKALRGWFVVQIILGHGVRLFQSLCKLKN